MTAPPAPDPAPRDDLLAPATLLVGDRDAYLGQGARELGRRVAADQVELFAQADAASALAREISLHGGGHLAVHDVGSSGSLRLVAALARAGGGPMQKLAIRRQGQGIALAVLPFAELHLAGGETLRVYTTDVNADAQTRARLARLLLAHSRLGVLLVGELPPHALQSALAPLHEALREGPWPNRELLVVPMGAGTAIATHAAQLAAGTPVSVHVAPRAPAADALWSYVAGTWNRAIAAGDPARTLPAAMADAAATAPDLMHGDADAATVPVGLDPLRRPAPAPPAAPRPAAPPQPMPVPGATRWQPYLDRCMALPGAVAACVLDLPTRRPVAAAGGPPAAERLAQQGAALLLAAREAARALGVAVAEPEAAVGSGSHHLLVRPVPGHPGIALHLVLRADAGPPALARLQLERIAPPQ